ncbi:MAG: hypothetical protein KKD64_01875 [Alphaproteobacteria bacterium]|nr:hypothetical protein [Alphaproteobacteria bacterium]MBU0792494.1 hypothetical protein [Alphaproteobacteria bacterium]MBU0877778.1 hypothetical protein [Alphaproteobacteria bacterium]MBU1768389.1 hypothetical protein [Alphaproteobacteria bacterium]
MALVLGGIVLAFKNDILEWTIGPLPRVLELSTEAPRSQFETCMDGAPAKKHFGHMYSIASPDRFLTRVGGMPRRVFHYQTTQGQTFNLYPQIGSTRVVVGAARPLGRQQIDVLNRCLDVPQSW